MVHQTGVKIPRTKPKNPAKTALLKRLRANGACRNRLLHRAAPVYPKNRVQFVRMVYPYKLDVVGARCAQAFAKLARTEAVRADRRLRTDDEAIRAQATIFNKPVFLVLK
jgi:hypothetical protein